MSAITTHVLDTSRGCPAAGIRVTLSRQIGSGAFETIGNGVTNADGRARDLLHPDAKLRSGLYRLNFNTAPWFADLGIRAFYPEIEVIFEVADETQHYHVPVLLSPYGYSTYRGS